MKVHRCSDVVIIQRNTFQTRELIEQGNELSIERLQSKRIFLSSDVGHELDSFLLCTYLGSGELGAELLHRIGMRPPRRAVIAVVLLDEDSEGVRRARSPLCG